MALEFTCTHCGKWWRVVGRLPAVACDCSGAEAEQLHGSPSVPGDSRVKVSDAFKWIDNSRKDRVTIETARDILKEVRRLEQIIQNANG